MNLNRNLCMEIPMPEPVPLMILQTIDEYIATESLQKGMANVSVIMRNIANLPFNAVSVIRTYLKKDCRDEVAEWCENSLSNACRMDFVNCKIYFADEDDALLFILRWKGEDVAYSFM